MRAGLDAGATAAIIGLYDSVSRVFGELIGNPPQHVAWVPGRLEVFGTHTDYAGGRTLVAAVPRGFAFVAARRTDGLMSVADATDGERVTVNPLEASPRFRGWRRYVEVAAERLARNFPGADLGADIVFASNLPRASGLSSSSALVVGIATTLVRLAGIRARPEWTANVSGRLDEAAYYACIENGLSFGALGGDAGVGTHGGSEDHAAMLCSTPGAMSAFAFVPMRHLETVPVPPDWRFVIASSGVTAEKTGSALEAYNRLAHGAQVLVELWNHEEAPQPSLAALLSSDRGAFDRLRTIVERSSVPGWSAEALLRRLEHFAAEDRRVLEAVRAFSDADVAAVSALARASQQDAEGLLGNQTEETVTLVRTALDAGAFAARSFGAGFGGSAWALTDGDGASSLAERWVSAYRARCPAGSGSVAFVAAATPPAAVLEHVE
ncbi:MAG TPA: galactokinase family protein [Vicinamibacterales bacterium]|nr:galactokinase family protein [Vicinamibacterales bacterium]